MVQHIEHQPEKKNEQPSQRISSQLSPPQSPRELPDNSSSRCIYPTPVWINSLDQRIDHRIPEPVEEATTAFNQLLRDNRGQKICYEHNLTANGCTHSLCSFDHSIRLPENQCLVLAKRARKAGCFLGTACRNANCVYSHVCAHDAWDKGCSLKDGCNLKRFHGIKYEVGVFPILLFPSSRILSKIYDVSRLPLG